MIYFFTAALIIFISYAVLPTVLIRSLNWGIVKEITEPHSIALTFDDGPDPQYTARLLDVLKSMKLRQPFSLLGKKQPSIHCCLKGCRQMGIQLASIIIGISQAGSFHRDL